MKSEAPSLVALVVRRIVIFAALAMVAQLAGVFFEYWSDTQNLGRLAIEMETGALARGVRLVDGKKAYALPVEMRARYGAADTGYVVRALDPGGAILYTNCAGDCDVYFPTRETRRLDFWMMELAPGKPLNISGGRSVSDEPDAVTIDVAILGDRDGIVYHVLFNEIQDHMALPMSLLLIVVLGATSLSIAQALRPVRESAALAARLDPLAPTARLPVEGMPREIADYAKAVNGALERIFALMRSQRLMTSAISHEVRTPLAIARLELERIADPRARKVEEDLEALNHLVEQLTTLARLESAGIAEPESIDPVELAQQVVAALASFVFASGRRIGFEQREPVAALRGHRAMIENALRNLIENAIHHGGAGATILVVAGPGPCLSVSDDGGDKGQTPSMRREGQAPSVRREGQAPSVRREGQAPSVRREGVERPGLGLKIVGRIAEIHGGQFEFVARASGGAVATLRLPPENRVSSPS